MINQLEIENFILIDHQVINFDKQINVLTGDTGSGKSVIINSIRFVLGMRANSDLFLDKTKNIKITANLTVNSKLATKLTAHEIEFDDELEVMRILSPAGKNKIRLNGELVSVAVVQDIFEDIITLYSQYSVAKFKTDNSYLQIIDNLINDKSKFAEYQVLYQEYQKISRKLNDLQSLALLKGEKQELLELRLNDLKGVSDEFDLEQLILEKKQLDNHAASYEISAKANEQFGIAQQAINNLLRIIESDQQLALLNDALINIDEVSFEIAKASEPVDERRLSIITEYISMCRRLARKYNVEIERLVEFKAELQAEFDNLDSIDADIANLENKLKRQYDAAHKVATEISQLRQSAAPQFTIDVNEHLKQLSLGESDFRVVFTKSELSANGIDVCDFEVKMNSGGQYTVIHKTASGGEIARFLLALEAVSSNNEDSSFIIFDEIDTGVSGHVATEMANMMKAISNNHKLLVVTHLAQVAAISQNHFVISKQTNGEYTTSSAKLLTLDEKPLALAKMISGIETSDDAIAHAKTLLEQI